MSGSSFLLVEGSTQMAHKLKVGNGEDCIPRNGRWNFNKQLFTPIRIERGSCQLRHCDTSHLSQELINWEGTRALHQAQDKRVCVCFMIQAS
ncbi:Protein argonaute 16 [Camellia lanceoleosa]|nr:Protein argonaute 16 [Camellia lanceoleosa]